VNCTRCGAAVIQGPDGRWSCSCGASGAVPLSATPYYTSDICSECGMTVQGLHGRWACGSCGANSPYLPPPGGWKSDPDVGVEAASA
jgi:ribosomal protein S27AE